jgi:Conserved TM helix
MNGLDFLNPILSGIGGYLPQILGTLTLLVGTFVAATVVRAVLKKVLEKAGLETRLGSPGLNATLAQAMYGLVWLLGLPPILSAFGLTALLDPINALVSQLLSFVPKLLGAVVILFVGLMIAKILREVVTAALTAAGSERLTASLNMGDALGKGGLGGLVGSVVFLLILLPVAVGALEPLGLTAITKTVAGLLETVTDLLPKLLGAGIILTFAVIMGRVIADIISAALAGLNFDALPKSLGMGENARIGGRTASKLVGELIMFGVILTAATQASEVLGIKVLTEVISSIGSFLAQSTGAVVVMLAGIWLANMAGTSIQKSGRESGSKNANIYSILARVGILFCTVPFVLRGLGLPSEIVILAFGSVVVALSVAMALAFGIGGQRIAANILEQSVSPMLNRPISSNLSPNRSEPEQP